MSERFRIVFLTNPIINSACSIEDTEQPIITYYNDLTYNMGSAKQICELLNQLDKENKKLKEENKELKRVNGLCEDQVTELRRLVHIANKYILDGTSENIQKEWQKELLRE